MPGQSAAQRAQRQLAAQEGGRVRRVFAGLIHQIADRQRPPLQRRHLGLADGRNARADIDCERLPLVKGRAESERVGRQAARAAAIRRHKARAAVQDHQTEAALLRRDGAEGAQPAAVAGVAHRHQRQRPLPRQFHRPPHRPVRPPQCPDLCPPPRPRCSAWPVPAGSPPAAATRPGRSHPGTSEYAARRAKDGRPYLIRRGARPPPRLARPESLPKRKSLARTPATPLSRCVPFRSFLCLSAGRSRSSHDDITGAPRRVVLLAAARGVSSGALVRDSTIMLARIIALRSLPADRVIKGSRSPESARRQAAASPPDTPPAARQPAAA